MQLLFPKNIFTKILTGSLDIEPDTIINFLPSALIAKELVNKQDAIALLPTVDLLNYKDLYVSKKYGLSFESSLGNSYLYYEPGKNEVKDLYLLGDISSTEAMLSKILFEESYNSKINVHLFHGDFSTVKGNILLIGNDNFIDDRFNKGVSFTEEVIDLISAPFVNFVLASSNKQRLEDAHKYFDGIETRIDDKVVNLLANCEFSDETKDYINSNISSMIVEFDEQDVEGINQIFRLPYYVQMIKDIVEVKFI
jgi:hypothetical protein